MEAERRCVGSEFQTVAAAASFLCYLFDMFNRQKVTYIVVVIVVIIIIIIIIIIKVDRWSGEL